MCLSPAANGIDEVKKDSVNAEELAGGQGRFQIRVDHLASSSDIGNDASFLISQLKTRSAALTRQKAVRQR